MSEPKKIPWSGGECPVSPGTRVRLYLRDGAERETSSPHDWEWDHGHDVDDILGFAILEPDWAVLGPELAQALKRLDVKYRSCARARGHSVATIELDMESVSALLARIDGGKKP